MKFSTFTGEKNLCILHGQVFIMRSASALVLVSRLFPFLFLKKRKFKLLFVFCDCTGRFVSDMVATDFFTVQEEMGGKNQMID